MSLFEHEDIIREYSTLVEIRSFTTGDIVDGRPQKSEVTYRLMAAILEPNYKRIENGSGFVIGDKVIYFLKSESYKPKVNDTFETSGQTYILKQELDNSYMSDYIKFLARRKVDES